MSTDTPFILLQVKLINRLFHESQWGHTSHSVDVFYDSLQVDLKGPLEEMLYEIIDEVQKHGGINKYQIQGETSGDTSGTMVFFDLNEDKLLKYLKLLEFQIKSNSNRVFKFIFNIVVDFDKGEITHGTKSYKLPINKNGIKMLSLLLAYYPNIVHFEQIDNEFNLTFERKNDPRLANKRIYEIRDDLFNFLVNKVHLSSKISKQFVENVRGVGYKIALKSEV